MLLNLTNWIGLVVPRKLFICFDHNVIQVEKVDFETIFLGKEDLDHSYSMAYIFNLPSIPLQLSNCTNIFTSRIDIVKWYSLFTKNDLMISIRVLTCDFQGCSSWYQSSNFIRSCNALIYSFVRSVCPCMVHRWKV